MAAPAAVTLGEFQRCLSAGDIVNKQRVARRRQWCICFGGQPALFGGSRSSFERSQKQREYKIKKKKNCGSVSARIVQEVNKLDRVYYHRRPPTDVRRGTGPYKLRHKGVVGGRLERRRVLCPGRGRAARPGRLARPARLSVPALRFSRCLDSVVKSLPLYRRSQSAVKWSVTWYF